MDDSRSLDKALARESQATHELAELVEVGNALQAAMAVQVVPPARERALFVEAVAARPRGGWLRVAAPLVTAAAALVALGYAASGAAPGDSLYPVREVLQNIGLAGTGIDAVDDRIDSAQSRIERGEGLAPVALIAIDPEDRNEAIGHAIAALGDLGVAADVLDRIDAGDEEADRYARIAALERRATSIIVRARTAETIDDSDDDDNSGPGSGDDADDGDSSGPGSGDGSDDDDNSGPGSGDDSDDDRSGSGSGDGSADDDDNSGPGSGDDSDDDDNSGPGSGDDSDDDDNSGPGSGDSEDDSDDSSGSGSGDDFGPDDDLDNSDSSRRGSDDVLDDLDDELDD